jgi:EmrB/QacA subfamily drug resistance transporter
MTVFAVLTKYEGCGVMFYLLLSNLLSVMNLMSIKILIPDIMNDLRININLGIWLINAFSLPLAVLLPVFGKLGDLYGSKRLFNFGILTFGIGSMLCGFATSFAFLIIARIIQAVGASQFLPSAMVLLLEQTPEDHRGSVLGKWGAVGASGGIIGQIFAGLLTDAFSWKSSFFLYVPLAAIILSLSLINSPSATNRKSEINTDLLKDSEKDTSFDYYGVLILMSAVTCFLLGITLLADLGWNNIIVKAIFGSSFFFLFLFYRIERVVPTPFFNLKLMANLRFSLGLFVVVAEAFVYTGFSFFLPIFLNTVQNFNLTKTAFLLTPTAVTVFFMSPLGGRISDRIGCGLPISMGTMLWAVSCFLLAGITAQTSYKFILFCMIINGIGFGFISVPALNSVLSAASSDNRGLAGGFHNMFRYIGGALGTTILGIIFYTSKPVGFTSTGISSASAGFHEVFIASFIVCLLGLLTGAKLAIKKW